MRGNHQRLCITPSRTPSGDNRVVPEHMRMYYVESRGFFPKRGRQTLASEPSAREGGGEEACAGKIGQNTLTVFGIGNAENYYFRCRSQRRAMRAHNGRRS